MKKLLFLLIFASSVAFSRPTVILEISYTHPIEVFYWERLTEDSLFNTMYELNMVESTEDSLIVKDKSAVIFILYSKSAFYNVT